MSTTDTNNQTNVSINLQTPDKTLSADFVLDGITVITGENNTSKSTINKILYTALNSVYNAIIRIELRGFANDWFYKEIVKQFYEWKYEKHYFLKNSSFLESLRKISQPNLNLISLTNTIKENIAVDENIFPHGSNETDLYRKSIINNYKYDIPVIAENLAKSALKKYPIIFKKDLFVDVFKEKISEYPFCKKNDIDLSLKIKNNNTNLDIRKPNETEIFAAKASFTEQNEIIYFDNAMTLDELRDKILIPSKIFCSSEHINNFAFLLTDPIPDNKDEIEFYTKSFQYILNKIDKECKGIIIYEVKKGFCYKEAEKEPILLNNVSAGQKIFLIIKTLLLNGSITHNKTMILEEPEVHLHPKYQLLLAEIIVLLQKELNLQILLNTHSPYFLEAIEVYSKKYNIQNKCKYYLAENSNNHSSLRDVTDETEEIYKQFAAPFQILENERYKDE